MPRIFTFLIIAFSICLFISSLGFSQRQNGTIKDLIFKMIMSITFIARKLFISEYKILEVNPKLNDYFDILKRGEVLKVPNAYAKDVTLYVDQLYFLPVGIKVSDDKGLFEQYDYFYLQVNPKIDDTEFTTGYKDYKF